MQPVPGIVVWGSQNVVKSQPIFKDFMAMIVTRSNYFYPWLLLGITAEAVQLLLLFTFNGLFAQLLTEGKSYIPKKWAGSSGNCLFNRRALPCCPCLCRHPSFNAILQWKIKHTQFLESFNRWWFSASASGPFMSKQLVAACRHLIPPPSTAEISKRITCHRLMMLTGCASMLARARPYRWLSAV